MDAKALARELMTYFHEMRNHPIRDAHNMTMGEKRVLGYLMEETDCATPTRLSEAMCLSTARVANVLNSLEKKGMIVREHGTKDRRKVYVRVTEAGRAECQAQLDEALDNVARLLEALGEEDAMHYVRISQRLAQIEAEEN